MSSGEQHSQESPPRVISAIDVGSSGIRMEIAQADREGSLSHLDSLQRSVLLGNDTFNQGRLSSESIQTACDALLRFKAVMDENGVTKYRAVATNAVREAENCDTFIDHVRMMTGLNLEVIEGPEQSRLTFAAVQNSLAGDVDFGAGVVAVVEVGGGAADVMLFEEGEAIYGDTFSLGAIRIRQVLRNSRGSLRERKSFLHHIVQAYARNIRWSIPLDRADTFIALGGDVRFLAQRVHPEEPTHARRWNIPRKRFSAACQDIADEDIDELAHRYSLSFGDASTLGPALFIYDEIVQASRAEEIIISNANIRDGVLLDLASQESGKGRMVFREQIVASAVGLARKYQTDETHSLQVARTAVELFDELRAIHGLGDHERLLLEVAAVLHEVGLFVSNRAHHKHALYLISSSEIFGLSRHDIAIVANVARYHRRSPPHSSHSQYMDLDRAERVVASKLAGILRVADSLDNAHVGKVLTTRFERQGEELRIIVPRELDIRLESLYLEEKGELFRELFGLRPVFVPTTT